MSSPRATGGRYVNGASKEQDRAAGGRDLRLVALATGSTARASIELKQRTNDTACWAYLRWSIGGRTQNRYVGRVHGHSRIERLRQGWELARARGLVVNAAERERAD